MRVRAAQLDFHFPYLLFDRPCFALHEPRGIGGPLFLAPYSKPFREDDCKILLHKIVLRSKVPMYYLRSMRDRVARSCQIASVLQHRLRSQYETVHWMSARPQDGAILMNTMSEIRCYD